MANTSRSYDQSTQQRIIDLVKGSLKGGIGQMKAVAKAIDSWNDLENIIDTIYSHCDNQWNVTEDLKSRINRMKLPKTRQLMLENAQLICQDIKYLQQKDMLKDTNPIVFDSLAGKVLHPWLHKPKFKIHMNEVLRHDDEGEDEFPDMTEMQKILQKIENPHYKKRSQNNKRPIAEMSYRKISILYDYFTSFTHSFNMETRFSESVEKTGRKSL